MLRLRHPILLALCLLLLLARMMGLHAHLHVDAGHGDGLDAAWPGVFADTHAHDHAQDGPLQPAAESGADLGHHLSHGDIDLDRTAIVKAPGDSGALPLLLAATWLTCLLFTALPPPRWSRLAVIGHRIRWRHFKPHSHAPPILA